MLVNKYLVEQDNTYDAIENIIAVFDKIKELPNNNIQKIYVVNEVKKLMEIYYKKNLFSKREMSDATAAMQKATFTPYMIYNSLFDNYAKSEGDVEDFYINTPLSTMEVVAKQCNNFLKIFNEETYLLGDDKEFLLDCLSDLISHMSSNLGTGMEFKYLSCITRAFKVNHNVIDNAGDFVDIFVELMGQIFDEYRIYYGDAMSIVNRDCLLQDGPFTDILSEVGLDCYIKSPSYAESLSMATVRFELAGVAMGVKYPTCKSESIVAVNKLLSRYGQLGKVVMSCFIAGYNDTINPEVSLDYSRALLEFRDFGHIMIVAYNFNEMCRMIKYFGLFKDLLEPNRVTQIFEAICLHQSKNTFKDRVDVYNELVESNFSLLENAGIVPKGTKEKYKRGDLDGYKKVEI